MSLEDRNHRQATVQQWCVAAFGAGQAASVEQRGLRHVEEAIEAAQAAGCAEEQVLQLVRYVFRHTPGNLAQELGGSGLTLLALAAAAGVSADAAEAAEVERVLAKALEHFAQRNEVKNAAGFLAAGLEQEP